MGKKFAHVEGTSSESAFESGEAVQVVGVPYDEVDRALGAPDDDDSEKRHLRFQRTMKIRRVVLAAILGQDGRSFQEMADEIGVTRAAISKVHVELAERLGWHWKKLKPPSACISYSKNARARWREWGQKSKPTAPPV
jgi:hypothetical protein